MVSKVIRILISALFLLSIVPSSTLAANVAHNCTISEVQLVVESPKGLRVAARCSAPAPGGVYWFAYGLMSNPEHAKMVLSILSTAKVSGRSVVIRYESTDTTGDGWGCQAANCRKIMQVVLQ